MGCGGSRTDGLEPRYQESWTKETESTWLTSTDADIPLSSLQTLPLDSSPGVAFGSEKSAKSSGAAFFDDGFPNPAQAYLKVCSMVSDSSFAETKTAAGESQVTNKPLNGVPSTGTTVQKRSVLCTEKTKWQSNRMANKQVAIMVTQSIQQIDTSGRILGTSCTTYGLANPAGEKGKA